jgi:uncharacterized protein (DUF736 family)|tara:strand:- start:1164 stop:1385 length:222 start_codon:yes stop_codon:yes gene_type:complete
MPDFKMKDETIRLWKNKYKESGDKKPDYTGNALVGGKKLQASLWINTNDNGEKYLSGQFQPPRGEKAKDEPLF